MSTLILAPWEWVTKSNSESFWRAPGGTAIGVLDRRSNTQSAIAGGVPQGAGFFSYPDGAILPSGTLNLGSDIERMLTVTERDGLLRLANIKSQSTDSILDAIYGSFLNPDNYDPTGETKCKPLRTSRRTGLKCYLGGFGNNGLIINERFAPTHAALTATLAVRWADYRRIRDTTPLDVMERWTGHEMQALYGRRGDDLLPALVPPEYLDGTKGRDSWQIPRTTRTESFNQADSTTLGPDLTWVEGSGDDLETLSNIAAPVDTGADQYAWLNSSNGLSSDAHFTQIDAITLTSSGSPTTVAVLTRVTDNLNWYRMALEKDGGTITAYHQKRVAGSFSTFQTTNPTLSLPDTIKHESSASDVHKMFFNGSQEGSDQSDTAHTGQLLPGFSEREGDGNSVCRADDFEAADLAVGIEVLRRRIEEA